jgi:transcriptional regulator with XRE-family HTH domain
MDLAAVGKRVKALREQKGWKQSDLATAAGVAANTISGLERASRQTRWPQFERIAKALGTTTNALLHGQGITQNRLLEKLSDEDLRIAERFHDASTSLRILIERLLRLGAADPMIVFWDRVQTLAAHQQEDLRLLLERYERLRSEEHRKQKS